MLLTQWLSTPWMVRAGLPLMTRRFVLLQTRKPTDGGTPVWMKTAALIPLQLLRQRIVVVVWDPSLLCRELPTTQRMSATAMMDMARRTKKMTEEQSRITPVKTGRGVTSRCRAS